VQEDHKEYKVLKELVVLLELRVLLEQKVMAVQPEPKELLEHKDPEDLKVHKVL